MMKCIECGSEFTGRSDKVYCSKICRKRAENSRVKMQRIMTQLEQLPEQAEAARIRADYHRVRVIRARIERLKSELARLAQKYEVYETRLWLNHLKALAQRLP